MKIDKFDKINEDLDTKKKKYPYEITEQGELKKTVEYQSSIKLKRCVYLTDDQYNKLKDLSEKTKKQCDNLDEMKKSYVDILKAAISKVKKDEE